jgi:hypothetical protein
MLGEPVLDDLSVLLALGCDARRRGELLHNHLARVRGRARAGLGAGLGLSDLLHGDLYRGVLVGCIVLYSCTIALCSVV